MNMKQLRRGYSGSYKVAFMYRAAGIQLHRSNQTPQFKKFAARLISFTCPQDTGQRGTTLVS
jgi:hypothetical protein